MDKPSLPKKSPVYWALFDTRLAKMVSEITDKSHIRGIMNYEGEANNPACGENSPKKGPDEGSF